MRRRHSHRAEGDRFTAGATPGAGAVLDAARRRSHDTTTMTWTLIYGGVLVTAMVSAMAASAWSSALRTLATQSNPATTAALAVMLVSAQTMLWCAVGPAHLRPAMARWLGPTPLDRGTLLGRTLVVTTAVASALGALAGLFVGLASDTGPGGSAGFLLTGVAAGLGSHQLALWASAQGRCEVLRWVAALTGAGAALTLTGMTRFGWFDASGTGHDASPLLAAAACVVAGASLGCSRAWARRVAAARLRSAGGKVERALDALVMLETSAPAGRPTVGLARSVVPRGVGPSSIVMADARAVWRRRREVGARTSWVVALWAVAALLTPAFGAAPVVVGVAVLVGATVAVAARGLSMWLGSSSLWRMFPQRPVVMTASFAVAPLALGAAVGLVAAWGSGLGWVPGAWVAFGSALAAMAAVVRRASSPAMEVGSMIETPAGQVPTGILMAVLHGPDQVIIWLGVGALAGGVRIGCGVARAAGVGVTARALSAGHSPRSPDASVGATWVEGRAASLPPADCARRRRTAGRGAGPHRQAAPSAAG